MDVGEEFEHLDGVSQGEESEILRVTRYLVPAVVTFVTLRYSLFFNRRQTNSILLIPWCGVRVGLECKPATPPPPPANINSTRKE